MPDRRHALRVFFILATIFGLVFMQRTGPGLVTPTLIRQFHVTPVTLSFMTVAQYLAYALLQIPVGYWGQRYGPERFVALGTILDGAGTVFFGLAHNFSWIVTARLFVGVGDALIWLNIVMVLAREFDRSVFGQYLGWIQMAGTFGALLATIPLAWWIGAAGWHIPFVILGLFLIVMGLISIPILRTPKDRAAAQALPRTASALQPIWRQLAQVMRRGTRAWGPALASFGFMGAFLGFSSLLLVPYLQAAYHLSRVGASAYEAIALVGMFFGGPVAGLLSDRIGRKLPFVIFGALDALAWASLTFRPVELPPAALAISFIMMGFANGGSLVLTFASIRDLMHPEEIGVASGLVNSTAFAASALVPLLMGAVLTALGQDAIPMKESLALAVGFGASLIGLLGVLVLPTEATKAPVETRQLGALPSD